MGILTFTFQIQTTQIRSCNEIEKTAKTTSNSMSFTAIKQLLQFYYTILTISL